MRVLMITSEWPTEEHPEWAPYIVRQVEYLRREGLEVEVFPFRGRKSPIQYWRAWRGVKRELEANSYDLVHAQWGHSALLVFPKRVPLVVTFRGSDVAMASRRSGGRFHGWSWLGRQISRWVAGRADEVIAVSRSLAQLQPRADHHVIPSGLDLDLFRLMPQDQARRELGLPREKRLVLFSTVARGISVKRQELAEAAVRLLDQRFAAELVVAAGVPHHQMPVYMNACDLLLLTSVYEGSPNVVKEALACNLPVVSVDVGDVRERIESIAGCVLCGDDRPETIARAIESVLFEGRRIEGRAAMFELDETRIARRVASVYRKAVGTKPGSSDLIEATTPIRHSSMNTVATPNSEPRRSPQQP